MKTKNFIIGAAALLGAATGAGIMAMKNRRTIPKDVKAVHPFDAQSYLGKWYEVARLPMRFEKGLTKISAYYSLNPDGSVKVINRGYEQAKGRWRQSEGIAKFVISSEIGQLKVSFFGPFYAGYNVVAIDKDYKYALVFGRNLNYMWLMSREKTMPAKYEKVFLEVAADAGYDLSELIWTEQ